MTNIYYSGPKASEPDATKELMQHTAGIFDGRFTVKFQSDDGGRHIALVLEVAEPNERLPKFLSDSLGLTKWMGWRMLILKVPIGYIDGVMEKHIPES